jgi:branched-chain amino acid transport system ATP-binding protein
LVALLGTNGAGKSTLLRAITGLTEASNGAIFLGGDDITHVPPYEVARRGVVLMPGGRGVFPGMTVAENLDLADWVGGKHTVARRRRVLDEFFPSLKARLGQKAGSLSGGEQQMLALAQAFIMDARLLLIDELSLGLAPAVVEQLLAVLKEIRASGTTVLMVEQSVELALRIADRAVFMEKGEVRFSGPATDLRGRQDLLRSVFLRGGSGGSGPMSARTGASLAGRDDVVLEARAVATSYGGVRALEDVSLTVHRNEVVGIIGPNGAGKTTLFDALSGFLRLDAGQVIFAGKDVSLLAPDARARMGLTRAFQDSTLFPTLTVRETLMASLEKVVRARFAVMTATWTPAARQGETLLRRRADRLMEMFGLEPFADRFVVELSTGTRRILGMAVVVATEPDVVLLDEPSSGLAQTETEELGPLLRRVQLETGCGLVVIEHDMKLIQSVSDRLVAMDLGRVLLSGAPDEVLADHRVVSAYLGGAATNGAEAQTVASGQARKGAEKEE